MNGPTRRVVAFVTVAGLILSGCSSLATSSRPPASISPASSTTTSLTSRPRLLPARMWINVSVATLWVAPGLNRPVDRPVINSPISTRAWVSSLTLAQKQWLVGRLETQATYATPVVVTQSSGNWSRVVVTDQSTPRDPRGYPGWLPSWQLSSVPPPTSATVAVVRVPTVVLSRLTTGGSGSVITVLSYGTRLPVVSAGSAVIRVGLVGGGSGYVVRSAVSLRPTTAVAIPFASQVVAESRRFLGLGYLWAGTSAWGFDCSGFTYAIFRTLGASIPRDAAPQSLRGVPISRSKLAPGDLVFFRDARGGVGHVGIYIGFDRGVASVIHAPNTGRAIMITPLAAWTTLQYAGARRYDYP